jgi:two-component system LytT family sensor kinase
LIYSKTAQSPAYNNGSVNKQPVIVNKQHQEGFHKKKRVNIFTDIYHEMKIFTIKRFSFYVWLGAALLLLAGVNSFLNHPEAFAAHILNEAWRIFYLVIVNLVFFENLPLITRKRSNIIYNILSGILLLSLHLMSVSFGLYYWTHLGTILNIYTQFRQSTLMPGGAFNEMLYEALYQAEAGIASVFFFGMAKLLRHNFTLRQAAQQMRLEKKEAELNYLKSQTNPHFLFNTLNNIYALAKDKSDLAPESILRLSKILRFMLYETSGKFITIQQELDIITDYIALEKLRYDDSLHIILNHDIGDGKQSLPPLLLIPLVENAFKHGVSESDAPFVEMHLAADQQQLAFTIKNSAENQGEPVKENIGLSNLKRQLELLYNDYQLFVWQEEMIFTATLKINLLSHV